jgi:hypothetical protein
MPVPGRRQSRADSSRSYRLGGEGESQLVSWHSALRVGTYRLRSHYLRGHAATLGSLLLDRSPKSKPFTPLFSCRRPHVACTPPTTLPPSTPDSQRGIPPGAGDYAMRLRLRLGCPGGRRYVIRRVRSGKVMIPVGAGGGRNAPTGIDRQGRSRSGSPGLPRDETRLSRRLGRNPPSEPQSPLKTPSRVRMVAFRDEKIITLR